MSAIADKLLENGLIDKATAEIMERMGLLAPGSVDKVKEDAMKGAAVETLRKFADDVHSIIEKDRVIRETRLDLERIRWPAIVEVHKVVGGEESIAEMIPGVVDRMGRYYFSVRDVEEEWFVPGYELRRFDGPVAKNSKKGTGSRVEIITEANMLYAGEEGVCIQVSVMPKE